MFRHGMTLPKPAGQGEGTGRTRCLVPPLFGEGEDPTLGAQEPLRQAAGEELARAGDDRDGRRADRRPAGPLRRLSQAVDQELLGRPCEDDRVALEEGLLVGTDHASHPGAGAEERGGAAVGGGRVGRVGRDVAEDRGRCRAWSRTARRPDRSARLGRAARWPGRRSACASRPRTRALRSGAARCRSGPGRRLCPGRAGSGRSWSSRCR